MGEIKLRKANRIVSVTENELDKYLSKGYEVVDKPQPQPQPEKVEESIEPVIVDAEPKDFQTQPTKRNRKHRD